jgi:hypothetical protein
MIDQGTSVAKSRAMETVEKQTAVFPPFPQPLLLTNQSKKRQPNKNNRRSFTQNA